jgi:hypothetical protein
MSRPSILVAAAAVLALSACGERAQTMPVAGSKKASTPEWQITDNGYLAPGWTPGDEASWAAQIAKRAQAQNDYAPR